MVDQKGNDRRTAIVLDDSDDEVLMNDGAKKQVEDEVKPVNSMAAIGDRALMERERLERQRKRRREAGLPEEDDDDTISIAGSSSKVQKVTPQRTEVKSGNRSNGKESQDIPLYWSGTIKKSFNIHSKSAPGTPFEDFLRPTTPFRANGLTHVIMATFCEDIQWLSQMFPKGESAPEITMITLAQGELKAGVYAPLHPQLPNWIRLVVPRRGLSEYTTMHMKFIILFYEDRLRLMILSGNLVDYDWRRIENTAFIHDFPRLKNDEKDTTSEYGKQMRRILSSLSVPAGHYAMRMMESYDMSSKCEARIVASIPTFTPVTGWAAIEELGIGRLGKVVREILGNKMLEVDIEAQGSSMGSYSPRWLQQFHLICTGADYRKHLPLPTGAKAVKAWASATKCKESEQWPPMRLLFPSDSWVKKQSVEGVSGALTFFGKKKVSIEKGFIKLLHQPVSLRGNIMMHHKAIVAIKKGCEQASPSDENEIIGWAYMGSHNLTQAAWGNISSGKKGGEVQLSINNWELGVVVPMCLNDLHESQKPLPEGMKANIITWKRPAQKYKEEDVPWDQFDQR
ncbi:phospholipase D/nuclease [Meira miltonrushii]|uniref:Phospholipase D/nuclease n=1 Tax=Meira miltonrushii TaxID=1280837 RepID=A0A316V3H6_9BASI|nr:phospholipase D/nuclease [Meira miltonrushii]PWN32106.1 phospholipase D/nuclease [Meira miltonrushii]